jgi:O-antigen ligase
MKDLIKLLLALLLYGGFGPMLGGWLSTRRVWQRAIFALMLVMTAMRPGNFMMMIGSIETYRGHTKGYEISLIEVLAIALIVAVRRGPRLGVSTGIPGLWLYLLWCGTCLLSMLGSSEPTYALMAASRFAKGALTFAAAALYLRDEDDLRWAVGALAGALFHHGLLCLKMRLLDGSWQVKGWFEHQNPMAMWCYMGALPVLAALLWQPIKGRLCWLCLAGFGGAGLCILLSVSRAALAAYAVGAAIVLLGAWLRGPNVRVIAFTAMGALGAVVVFLFAMDSFKARLNEVANSSQVVEEDLRDILNKQSAAMLKDHPWNGIGWNNFGIANSRGRGDKYSEILEEWDRDRGFTIYDENYYANPLTESLYWLWLSETGWLGFSTFIMFAAMTLWCAGKSAWRDRGTLFGAFAFALFVALAICYLHGTVERILTQTKNLSQWLMLAGMAVACSSRAKTDGAQLRKESKHA